MNSSQFLFFSNGYTRIKEAENCLTQYNKELKDTQQQLRSIMSEMVDGIEVMHAFIQ